ncbi:unnamed protein product, partial [Ixodes hexagonus]
GFSRAIALRTSAMASLALSPARAATASFSKSTSARASSAVSLLVNSSSKEFAASGSAGIYRSPMKYATFRTCSEEEKVAAKTLAAAEDIRDDKLPELGSDGTEVIISAARDSFSSIAVGASCM